MKALVKYAKGKANMEIRDLPIPKPDYGEVLIKIEACGICGTDLKIYDDTFINNPPVIVGHEFAGKVVEIGEGVSGWKIGDRVVSEQHVNACGLCSFCLTGRKHFCTSKRSPGYLSDGAFAEYITITASLLHKIPEQISFEEAALIEPMAVAAYGILGRTVIKPEDFVVILGCGPIALLALQMVKVEGASKVLITGLNSDEKKRFALAKQFGADYIINVQKDDPINAVLNATEGVGADVVIDLSGANNAILQGFEMLKKDGRFCALGLPHGDVSIPWTKLALKAAHIHFSYSSDYTSWERCLSMINNKKIILDEFIKDIYSLDDWEVAFDKARSGEALKVIIKNKI